MKNNRLSTFVLYRHAKESSGCTAMADMVSGFQHSYKIQTIQNILYLSCTYSLYFNITAVNRIIGFLPRSEIENILLKLLKTVNAQLSTRRRTVQLTFKNSLHVAFKIQGPLIQRASCKSNFPFHFLQKVAQVYEPCETNQETT